MAGQRGALRTLRVTARRAIRRFVYGLPFSTRGGRRGRQRPALLYSRYSRAYFQRWLLLGALIGVVAGVGAILFYSAIALCSHLLLGLGAGFFPPSPASEGTPVIQPIARRWLLPVITTLGGLLTGIIVFSLAPEAEGHGTDAAIESFHEKGGHIRSRVPLIKMIASAITIGSGGSAGREGPTAQISAGFGSWLANLLHLDDHDRRIAMAAGIGSGIGAIFKAPFGGALLSAEILYKRDFEADAVFPTFIASVVGFSIYGTWAGWTPIFGIGGHFTFDHPINLIAYLLLGICAGLVGLLYPATLYRIRDFFAAWRVPQWLKPAIGGLLVGLIGLVLPEALGMGYGYVQFGVNSDFTHLAGWLLLILVFVKILTTSLTIGSGGSGGVFGPGMVIGGFLGGALWALLNTIAPALVAGMPPGAFVVVGMGAFFGGIAKAPLAVILMVAEMTGEYSLIVPAMLTTMVAYLITGDVSIYEKQVPTRLDSPAHKDDYALPLLRNMSVRDVMQPVAGELPARILPDTTLRDVARLMRENDVRSLPVTQNGLIVGMISARDLSRVAPDKINSGVTRVRQVMRRKFACAFPDESLYTAWIRMSRNNLRQLVIVRRQHPTRMAGILTAESIASLLRAPVGLRAHSEAFARTSEANTRTESKAETSAESPGASQRRPGRTGTSRDPLAQRHVADVMGPAPALIPASTPLAQVREMLLTQQVLLVSDEQGTLYGIITPADVSKRANISNGVELTAGDIAVRAVVTAQPDEPLHAAVRRMARMELRQLPVIENGAVIGLIRRSDVLSAYARAVEDAGTPATIPATSEQPS
ncbi:MAG TPA: chloride channel protein [Ktedonobacterales bacterium]